MASPLLSFSSMLAYEVLNVSYRVKNGVVQEKAVFVGDNDARSLNEFMRRYQPLYPELIST